MKHRCAICNAKLVEGRYVYSRWTGNRYCDDDKRHRQISRRKKRLQAA